MPAGRPSQISISSTGRNPEVQIAATLPGDGENADSGQFRLDPIHIQMLWPRWTLDYARYPRELNVKLQAEYEPPSCRPNEPGRGEVRLAVPRPGQSDQTENNYDKDVFNGDIGQIVKIDLSNARSR